MIAHRPRTLAATLVVRGMVCFMLQMLATEYCAAQRHGQALIDSCLTALPHLGEDTGKAFLLSKLGTIYASIDPAKGLEYGGKALQLSQKLQWPKGIANAYVTLGNSYVYRSDYTAGLAAWDKARVIFEEQHDKAGMLKIIGNIGAVYEFQGNYSRALENHFLALKYAEELGDRHSIALNFGNIGSTYNYLKNEPKALEYDFRALHSFEALHDTLSMAIYLGNIGNIYFDKKAYDTSLKYGLLALQLDERAGNNEGIARGMANLGAIYVAKERLDDAFDYYFKSLAVSVKGGFKLTEANARRVIGEALMLLATDSNAHPLRLSARVAAAYRIPGDRKGLLNMAISYFQESIAINKTSGNLNELQRTYFSLSDAQRRAGDLDAALLSLNNYIVVKDSVFSLDSKIKVANLETKRELDLKNKQIEIDRLEVAKKRNERVFFIAGILLLLGIVAFVIRNITLRSARELSENKLQAFQARMNPHFIFNSLNSIQSLVLNGETINSITYLSRFSKLMRQILDSSAKSKVVLQTELDMLRGYIELEKLRFDAFTYEINVAPGITADSIRVPAMIIQPFIENAIIHGILPKKGEGRLSVSFKRKDEHIICTIDDNGIGRKASAALNAERRKDHESQGIAIASNRLALLSKNIKGSVTYIDKEEAGIATGTRVILQIPIL